MCRVNILELCNSSKDLCNSDSINVVTCNSVDNALDYLGHNKVEAILISDDITVGADILRKLKDKAEPAPLFLITDEDLEIADEIISPKANGAMLGNILDALKKIWHRDILDISRDLVSATDKISRLSTCMKV